MARNTCYALLWGDLMLPVSRPAIVVPVFNRPASLRRLLNSLGRCCYPSDVPLVFSLEGGCSDECARIVEAYEWPFGTVSIHRHEIHKGLREHILWCGDLSQVFGSMVLLEDDLCVSSPFYSFATRALETYLNEPRIAGVSLYSFRFNEFGNLPFIPLDDGEDVYFVQSASSWGQAWTGGMWSVFREWVSQRTSDASLSDLMTELPRQAAMWPSSSWKKLFNAFMLDTDRYFVVPRRALSTPMGDAGTHFRSSTTHLTVPLYLGTIDRACGVLPALADSIAVYDAFFELRPRGLGALCPEYSNIEFEIDFYGQKPANGFTKDWVLTTRPVSDAHPERSYGIRHFPPELNVVFNEGGRDLVLVRSHQVARSSEGAASHWRHFFTAK